MSSDEYLPMTHYQCGETAFSLRKSSIVARELILASHARMPDGTTPNDRSKMVCGHCGDEVSAPREPVHILHEQGFGTVYTSGVPVPA